jgi:hypothetical protein
VGILPALHTGTGGDTHPTRKFGIFFYLEVPKRMFGKCSFVPKFINDPPKSPLKRGTFTPLFKGGQGGSNKIFDTSQTSSKSEK